MRLYKKNVNRQPETLKCETITSSGFLVLIIKPFKQVYNDTLKQKC